MQKTAFVTGGSRGIGRGIAQLLAQKGYDIAFTYHSKADEAASLKREIEALGRRCFYYQATMQDPEVPQQVTDRAIADLGRLDLMVCNAGLTVHNYLFRMTAEEIDFPYDLDFRSYLICAQRAAKSMIEKGIEGTIVMISSTRGLRAYPEDPLYGGMKAALHRACESMALELSEHRITINCVAPGATAIRGEMTEETLQATAFSRKIPLGRMGTPKGIASLIHYLDTEGRYITGSVLRVDGGLIIPMMPEDDSEDVGPAWAEPNERLVKGLV
jgi:glucose 1-dehydrogenase